MRTGGQAAARSGWAGVCTLTEQILEKAMEKDLAGDEDYRKGMLAKSQSLFDEAEKTFNQGQAANETGDKFQLPAVLYAISLCFGGLVQVFRHGKMRWAILTVGGILLVGATGWMLSIPWTFSSGLSLKGHSGSSEMIKSVAAGIRISRKQCKHRNLFLSISISYS
jgi:hypothetical protein